MPRRKFILDAFHFSPWTVFLLFVVLLAAVLIYMLMRYERRLVPKKIGYTLLVLRAAVLVVLFFTLLEPVLRWTIERDENARILVAIDLSESMSTADIHALKGEKLRWARAVGMIGNEKTNDRIDRWIADYQSNREPRWVDPDETRDPEKRAALAQTRKENVEGILKEIDGLSRKEIALRLLTKGTSPLLKRLNEVGKVDLLLFAGKAEGTDEAALEKAAAKPPTSLRADASDMSTALTAASGGEDTTLMAVVLLTDGRDNVDVTAKRAVSAAARLGYRKAPVYPVILGSVLRPTDISVGELKYPETAFKDDNPQLRARINTPGFEGRQVVVVLDREGADPIRKTVTPVGQETDVTFDLESKKVGRHKYKVRIDVQPGETRKDNNVKSFAMNIVNDKVRALLVEGEARWEFRFIDNALERDERVEAKRVVFRQPLLGAPEGTQKSFFPKSLDLPAKADDIEKSSFAEPDMLILGDVAEAELTEKGWKLIERFVSEAGGTLVMIAGKEHLPMGHRSQTLQALLPVTDLRPLDMTGPRSEGSPTERGFRLGLTPEGEREPMFQFEDDPKENERAWAGLPGHTWGLLGEAKKGATVFAYAVQPGQRQTLQAQRRSALIVHQHYGFGQVLWIGVDSTWRWRHRIGDRYHHRFWGQIGRWAATNKATAGNEFVKFGPERTEIEVGEDAVLRARWAKKVRRLHPNLKAKVEIYLAKDNNRGSPFSTVELKPDESRPLVDVGRAVSLPAGQYKVRLVTPGLKLGNGEPLETDLIVRDRLSRELQDLSSNRGLLSMIAEKSDGKLLLPDEANQIPELIRNPRASKSAGSEFTLWDHWMLLTVFFVLLTGEWVIRKLNGLP